MSTSAPISSSSNTVDMSSSDSSHGVTSFVPMLPEGNFQKWAWAVKAYLTPNDHVRVIKRTVDSKGKLHDPAPPTDAKEFAAWNQ